MSRLNGPDGIPLYHNSQNGRPHSLDAQSTSGEGREQHRSSRSKDHGVHNSPCRDSAYGSGVGDPEEEPLQEQASEIIAEPFPKRSGGRISTATKGFQQKTAGLIQLPYCLVKDHLEFIQASKIDIQCEGHGDEEPGEQPQPATDISHFAIQAMDDSGETPSRDPSSAPLVRTTQAAPGCTPLADFPPVAVVETSTDKCFSLEVAVQRSYGSISSKHGLSQGMRWEIEALADPFPVAPVTQEHLRELDLSSIQNTVSLRYDLCFDQDLFFQRVSGSCGLEKKAKATIFYRYMCLELRTVLHNLHGDCPLCQQHKVRYTMQSRVSTYFSTLLDLLLILVPESERELVKQTIDPPWLTRRVRAGAFDAVDFSSWLCTLLTRHCAPMRDDMAKEMRDKISTGAQNADMGRLTDGMECLLNLLEDMKIDIANHQIRMFKSLLIADAVSFLTDCFTKMLASDQLNLHSSREWFRRRRSQNTQDGGGFNDFETLLDGEVEYVCSPEASASLPLTTFKWDDGRLRAARAEVFDRAHLNICLSTFRELCGSRSPTSQQESTLESRVWQLMSDTDGVSEGVHRHVDAIELEILQTVHSIFLDASRGTSRRTKSNTSSHGKSRISAVAGKTTALPVGMHKSLKSIIDEKESFELSKLRDQIFAHTCKIARRFLRMESLQMSNHQQRRSQLRTSRGLTFLPPDMEDVASRLAHIGVVHWQVWANLAYDQ